MKAVIFLTWTLVPLVLSSSSLRPHKPVCRVPESYCRWIENGRAGHGGAFPDPSVALFGCRKLNGEVCPGDPQLGCLVLPGWACYENTIILSSAVITTATYPPVPTRTLLPSLPSQERSRAEPEIRTLVPTPHYSGRLDSTKPTLSPPDEIKFRSYRIINYYNPKWQTTTSLYPAMDSKKLNKDVALPSFTSQEYSSASDTPSNPIRTRAIDVTLSISLPQHPVTRARPAPFDFASHLHDIIPFTTTIYADNGTTRPSVPSPDDFTKPILEVTCVNRARLFWSDFKITWSAAWNDQRGCQKLFRAMDRRGPVMGWSCKQAADNNGYIMQAEGHRPRSPRSLVADAIREAFEPVRTRLLIFSEVGRC